MKLLQIIILLLTTIFSRDLILAQVPNIISNPNYGIIVGNSISSTDGRRHFFAYRGIPYAEPPLGELRFKPPVPYNGSLGILDATENKAICIQGDPVSVTIVGSEDCLFLNVYVPAIRTTSLPVLVFILGEGFIFGRGIFYEGSDLLMDKDIIYVTLNYRLGPFGFLSTEDMVVPGNNGLKDQILALKWVRDNIVYFGGDPNKVTLMGENAGAVSTSYLAQSPQAKGLFKRAVMMGGNTLNPWSLARRPRETAFELGAALGIRTDSSETLISQMRLLPAASISSTSFMLIYSKPNPLKLIFAPVKEPEHSGSVLSDRSYRILSEEILNPDEIIIGLTSTEGNSFLYSSNPNDYTTEEFMVPESLHIENATIRAEVAQKIREYYFPNNAVTLTNAAKLLTDTYFMRSSAKYMELASARNVVFAYEFYGGSSSEGYIDESSPQVADDLLTKRRWILITNFVITGDPTPAPDALLENLDWNSISNPNNIWYLEFGLNLIMKSDFHAQTMKFWDNIFNQYAVPPLDTY